MNRNHESLSPSSFVKGTTYYGDSRDQRFRSHASLANEKNETQEKPRIARPDDLAKYALRDIVQEPFVDKKTEEEHLKRLFVFPDTEDDRMFMRTSVTQDSLDDALDAYIAVNDSIKSIVNKYSKGGSYVSYREAAELIRNNNILRFELGTYLLDKLNHIDAAYYLQERHRNDAEKKRPNVAGYDEPMTSKEYSVLLALSMLDGTYKNSPGDKIYISKLDNGRIEAGQHRYVALKLLGLENRIHGYSEKRQ